MTKQAAIVETKPLDAGELANQLIEAAGRAVPYALIQAVEEAKAASAAAAVTLEAALADLGRAYDRKLAALRAGSAKEAWAIVKAAGEPDAKAPEPAPAPELAGLGAARTETIAGLREDLRPLMDDSNVDDEGAYRQTVLIEIPMPEAARCDALIKLAHSPVDGMWRAGHQAAHADAGTVASVGCTVYCDGVAYRGYLVRSRANALAKKFKDAAGKAKGPAVAELRAASAACKAYANGVKDEGVDHE